VSLERGRVKVTGPTPVQPSKRKIRSYLGSVKVWSQKGQPDHGHNAHRGLLDTTTGGDNSYGMRPPLFASAAYRAPDAKKTQ